MNWEKIGETSRNYKAQPSPEAWDRVQSRLQNHQKPVIKLRILWQAAAAVLCVFGAAGILYWDQSRPMLAEPVFTLEALNSNQVDQVAVMALDFRKFLEAHHPDLAHPAKK